MLWKLRAKVRNGVIGRSIKILPYTDRKKLSLVTLIQIFLGFLDLAGVALIGIVGSLAVSGISSGTPGGRISGFLEFTHLSQLGFQNQVAIIGLTAMMLLVLRTFLSVIFSRKILFFLSRRGSHISSELAYRWLSQPLTVIQTKSTQESVYSLTTGVQLITVGVVATFIAFLADAALLVIILIGLCVVDAITALMTIILFTFISLIIYKTTSQKSVALGKANASLSIRSNEKLVEVLSSYREFVVRNRREYYAREIGKMRESLADVMAEIAFIPSVSKYVIESSVIFGAVLISGIQFILKDATHAISTLAIFMAAGTRLAPAVMRMQQSVIQIKTNIGSAVPTLDLIDFLGETQKIVQVSDQVDTEHLGFSASVKVQNLTWKYPGSKQAALDSICLDINEGESVALVGPSGAGKTTLVDAILGVLPLDVDSVRISGEPPQVAVRRWSGAIAYVPQDVQISDGTIRENVGLGYPIEEVKDEFVWDAIDLAQLRNFVESLPDGLDSQVGERGLKISGGQRQRLGIARALFTKPKLLVLDEATSALDGQTEAEISNAIEALQGSVTIILIAHRLSTARNVNKVVYMSEGRIQAQGTFGEVRRTIPDFDRQAQLMGL